MSVCLCTVLVCVCLCVCFSIDCAGILKLRNSDIELRKGETDVGRKNTRVRLVFRTHLPLAPPLAPPGRVLALQVASLPIECCEWPLSHHHLLLIGGAEYMFCECSETIWSTSEHRFSYWSFPTHPSLSLFSLYIAYCCLLSSAFSSGAAGGGVCQHHFLFCGGRGGASAERHQLPANVQSALHGKRDRYGSMRVRVCVCV